jgi:acetolactate decarboxylase
MISRRHFLRSGLTVCACAACGVRAIAAEAGGPVAVKGSGYDLWFVGGQRETITNGRLASVFELKTLAGRPNLYGLGPIEQLRGEVTIIDSLPALARVASDGTVKVTPSFDVGLPFFVWSEVPVWRPTAIPAEIRSFEQLERFIPRAAASAGLNADRPLPFVVNGPEDMIEFHVLNRIGDGPYTADMLKKIQFVFEIEQVEAIIVGFHSTKHRGIFTSADRNIHMHFQTPDGTQSGHIAELRLGPGATLSLPAPAA